MIPASPEEGRRDASDRSCIMTGVAAAVLQTGRRGNAAATSGRSSRSRQVHKPGKDTHIPMQRLAWRKDKSPRKAKPAVRRWSGEDQKVTVRLFSAASFRSAFREIPKALRMVFPGTLCLSNATIEFS